jgi:hypothetical protein
MIPGLLLLTGRFPKKLDCTKRDVDLKNLVDRILWLAKIVGRIVVDTI